MICDFLASFARFEPTVGTKTPARPAGARRPDRTTGVLRDIAAVVPPARRPEPQT